MDILTDSNLETYISAGCILVYNSACNWSMIFKTFLVSHLIEVASIMVQPLGNNFFHHVHV